MSRRYGIVIDAGSTGSRLFLYSVSPGKTGRLVTVRPVKDENGVDVVKKVGPGLSTFATKLKEAPGVFKTLDSVLKVISTVLQNTSSLF